MSGARLERLGPGRYALSGVVDFESVPRLWREGAALEADGGMAGVDLGGVERADSSALALLAEWLRQARARGWELRFEHLPDQLLRMARISGVAALLGAD